MTRTLRPARMHEAHAKRRILCAAFVASITAARAASASHPPPMPEVQRVVPQRGHPERILIGTRYGGYYLSTDGRSFAHICQGAIGYDDTETYAARISGAGALLVSTGYSGIARSLDACAWQSWSPPPPAFIADLRQIAEHTWLALNGANDQAGFVNQIWRSDDDGQSWSEHGAPLPPELLVFGIDAAPDARSLSVVARGPQGAELVSSSDAGQTWARRSIDSDASAQPLLVGAAPGTARLVVVLTHASVGPTFVGDTILLSDDSRRAFASVYHARGALPGAALADDGTLFFGGPEEGLWRVRLSESPARPQRISALATRGLAYADGRLYTIGSEANDGYSVAVSSDGGTSFRALFSLCSAHASATCAPAGEPAATCSEEDSEGWQLLESVCQARPVDAGAPARAPGSESAAPAGEVRGAICSLRPRAGTSSHLGWLWAAGALLFFCRRSHAR